MKHIILFLLGIFLFILSFTLKEIFPIGLVFTGLGAYLMARYASTAWNYWKTTDPNYVPPPKKEYDPYYSYYTTKSTKHESITSKDGIPNTRTKLGPKKSKISDDETLEEMLERLNIKFKIDKTDPTGPR